MVTYFKALPVARARYSYVLAVDIITRFWQFTAAPSNIGAAPCTSTTVALEPCTLHTTMHAKTADYPKLEPVA